MSLTASSTEVRVIPDNAFYWYGYQSNLQACSAANGWTNDAGVTNLAASFNTNAITLNVTSNNLVAVAILQAPTSGKKLKIIATTNDSASLRLYTAPNKNISLYSLLHSFATQASNPTLFEYTYTAGTAYYVVGSNGAEGRGGNIYALMVE